VTKDAQIAELLSKNAALHKENAEFKADNLALTQRVNSLEAKVLQLLEQLSNLPKGKDSHNSHNPPSQDKYKPKRNTSLRKKSGRKPGGQQGHKGRTLLQSPNPDKTENFCPLAKVVLTTYSIKPLTKPHRFINASWNLLNKPLM